MYRSLVSWFAESGFSAVKKRVNFHLIFKVFPVERKFAICVIFLKSRVDSLDWWGLYSDTTRAAALLAAESFAPEIG